MFFFLSFYYFNYFHVLNNMFYYVINSTDLQVFNNLNVHCLLKQVHITSTGI